MRKKGNDACSGRALWLFRPVPRARRTHPTPLLNTICMVMCGAIMPRPRICRRVGFKPGVVFFKPSGIPGDKLEQSVLSVDEYEAVRLKDLEGLDQEECAEHMGISQPTFHRLVVAARRKIADSIINGKMLRISGGNFKIVKRSGHGHMGCHCGPVAHGMHE